jgi:signal peptidase II
VLFVGVTALGVLADQLTKWWVVHNIPADGARPIQVIPHFLDIVHAKNPGAAFGMLGDFEQRHWVFLVFTVVPGGVIFDMFRKLPTDDWYQATALGLVLSGAVGNAIDRVRQHYVTDFIRVYTDLPWLERWLLDTLHTAEWPSFNIADSTLVVGVVMFVIHQLFLDGGKAKPADAAKGTDAKPPGTAEPTA